MEFLAYRILYYVYLTANKKYTGGSSDLAHIMAGMKTEALEDPAVTHAMNIRKAIQQDNYHRFFVLYQTTPNMGNYILDLMIDTWRVQSLQKIVKAYKPSVSVAFVLKELAMYNEEEGLAFLRKTGCCLETPQTETLASLTPAAATTAGTATKAHHGTHANPSVENSTLEIITKDSIIDMAAYFTQEKLLL